MTDPPRDAGYHVDLIKQLEVFERAQSAEMKCDSARPAAGQREPDSLVEWHHGRWGRRSTSHFDFNFNAGPVRSQCLLFEHVGAELGSRVGGMADDHHQLMGAIIGCGREHRADARVVSVAGLSRAGGVGVPGADVAHDSRCVRSL